jgi:cytoskeletal protein CcmA (bactofilin family)
MAEQKEIIEDENKINTVIAPDINFKGTLKFKNSLKMKGGFHGKIDAEGHLIIGKDADITADITSKTVTIDGTVRGKIKATQKIELNKKSSTSGDIITQDLVIESGAAFNGSAIMVKEK